MRRARLLPAAAGALMLLAATVAWAGPDKCDAFVRAALASKRQHGWSRVIVTTSGALTAPQQARLRELGVDVVRHYTLIRGFACLVPTRDLPTLAAEPFVQHLSSDVRVRKSDDYTVPATGADVAYGQYKLDGSGIAVAVIDSGTKSGTALPQDLRNSKGSSRVVASVNFATGQSSADDACGHGTIVAGIVAGNGASSTGTQYYRTFYGIARNVNIVSLRVLDPNGAGYVSDAVAAIQWAVNNKRKYGIRVINLSLGHLPGDYYVNDPLCQAVEAAWKAGIVVVCAAGNGGRLNTTQASGVDNEGWGTAYGTIQSPANDPYVITVGAMKQDPASPGVRSANMVATYSSRGPSRLDFVLKPDIVAPGNRVISTRPTLSYLDSSYAATNVIPLSAYSTSSRGTLSYFDLSGTSMAAPVVSGAVALLLQSNSALTPDTIKARLMVSADKWGFPDGTGDACTFGAGYLNIPAALRCTATATTYALSPVLAQDSLGNVLIVMDKAIWGSGGVAPATGNPPPNTKAIWGDKAIWGSGTLSSSKAIWGSGIWADKAIWGSTSAVVDLTPKTINGE